MFRVLLNDTWQFESNNIADVFKFIEYRSGLVFDIMKNNQLLDFNLTVCEAQRSAVNVFGNVDMDTEYTVRETLQITKDSVLLAMNEAAEIEKIKSICRENKFINSYPCTGVGDLYNIFQERIKGPYSIYDDSNNKFTNWEVNIEVK